MCDLSYLLVKFMLHFDKGSRLMNKQMTDHNDWKARTVRNTIRLGFWTGAWVVTMAVAVFGPKFIWDFNTVPTIFAVLVNLGIGFGMIVANKHHLKGLDEMQQKIQLEAMALSLGVGLVVGLSYSTLDITNLIAFDAEISHLVILMGLTYLGGVVFGHRKYR